VMKIREGGVDGGDSSSGNMWDRGEQMHGSLSNW
jgi:hypothetical protein